MKHRKVLWIIGTILAVSLTAAPAANAAKKSGKIPTAKRYHVTQITERDVVVERRTQAGVTRQQSREVAPNPDAERGEVAPNPDAQLGEVTPNPDAQLGEVTPNPDAQLGEVTPNPDAQ